MQPDNTIQLLLEKKKALLEEQERLIDKIKTEHAHAAAWFYNNGIDLHHIERYAKAISLALLLLTSVVVTPITSLDKGEILSKTSTNNIINVDQLRTLDENQQLKLVWDNYGAYVRGTAEKYEIDPKIIMATIMTESNGNTYAKRNEPRINDASYGLGQLLYGTARGLGFKGNASELYDPSKNIDMIGKYHRYNIDRYGDLSIDQIATAYNAGNPYAKAYPGHVVKFKKWYEKFETNVRI